MTRKGKGRAVMKKGIFSKRRESSERRRRRRGFSLQDG
jgi:hypothetical protein